MTSPIAICEYKWQVFGQLYGIDLCFVATPSDEIPGVISGAYMSHDAMYGKLLIVVVGRIGSHRVRVFE